MLDKQMYLSVTWIQYFSFEDFVSGMYTNEYIIYIEIDIDYKRRILLKRICLQSVIEFRWKTIVSSCWVNLSDQSVQIKEQCIFWKLYKTPQKLYRNLSILDLEGDFKV